ncbi:hypothetical protein KK141_10000 [Dyella sp. LX-66]|uniref:hypothetical protein n=1 Tax=unclassified Dyella TaxID=2634549 RepID=UPI001BE016D6|nr:MULTISPECIES: hypothetical protein [unclassified Dyella]MBT2117060.1 hypothetical protein [Dyella sp. LX-1]MBT2139864.1 hypothetical protein [Dyella sp. LX-66]
MLRSVRPLLPLIAMLALSACTEWVQPGVSEDQRDRDLAACTANGHRSMPTDNVVLRTSGHYQKGEKQCKWRNGKKECSRKEEWIGPSEYVRDANEKARDALIEDCMYRRGYVEK